MSSYECICAAGFSNTNCQDCYPRTYVDEVQADNPLFYLRFGESSGSTAFDSSGNGDDATYSGTRFGRSLYAAVPPLHRKNGYLGHP